MLQKYCEDSLYMPGSSDEKYIVTHGGDVAHLDELLSCALIVALNKDIEAIYRRNPTESELRNPNVYVLDVGRQFDPKLNNYDHHQLNHDCTLSLLLKTWKLYDELSEIWEWLDFLVLKDQIGVGKALEFFSLPPNAYSIIGQPIAAFVCKLFGSETKISKNSFTFRILEELGKFLWKSFDEYREAIETFHKYSSFELINGDLKIVFCLCPESKSTSALSKVINKYIKKGVSIKPSGRSRGQYSVFRVGSAPLNFKLVEDEPEVTFAHQNGFLMVVNTEDKDRILELIMKSIV